MPSSTEEQWPWKQPVCPVTRGAFIVIEGLDRAGKTTQVKRLCDKLYLLGLNVKTLRFPGNVLSRKLFYSLLNDTENKDRASPIGLMINNYLQNLTHMDDHAIHLLFSANRWERAYVTKYQRKIFM